MCSVRLRENLLRDWSLCCNFSSCLHVTSLAREEDLVQAFMKFLQVKHYGLLGRLLDRLGLKFWLVLERLKWLVGVMMLVASSRSHGRGEALSEDCGGGYSRVGGMGGAGSSGERG